MEHQLNNTITEQFDSYHICQILYILKLLVEFHWISRFSIDSTTAHVAEIDKGPV